MWYMIWIGALAFLSLCIVAAAMAASGRCSREEDNDLYGETPMRTTGARVRWTDGLRHSEPQ